MTLEFLDKHVEHVVIFGSNVLDAHPKWVTERELACRAICRS